MKLIQSLSYSSAYYLSKELNQDHKKRAEFYFGFQAFYGSIFKIIILLALAKVLGCVSTAIIVALTFSSFRFFAGGVHMGTYSQCAFITLFFFLAAAITAQVLEINRMIFILLFLTTIFTLCCIMLWAPKDSPMNVMSENSKKKLKTLSILCLFFWILVSAFFIYYGYNKGTVAICLALLIETSTFIPSTSNLYEKLNCFLNKKRRKA